MFQLDDIIKINKHGDIYIRCFSHTGRSQGVRCPHCGAYSKIIWITPHLSRIDGDFTYYSRSYVCDNGHRFKVMENIR
ncbi:hypothetical protein [uncultured Veillonella sp.]|uniref:hypothetical protein n=1 Tax=uncultured Veillonella sp. TaxID=159268 RepID=UPI0025D784BC|nr:hypothetical protein [uncultured Veillonella sp.]